MHGGQYNTWVHTWNDCILYAGMYSTYTTAVRRLHERTYIQHVRVSDERGHPYTKVHSDVGDAA